MELISFAADASRLKARFCRSKIRAASARVADYGHSAGEKERGEERRWRERDKLLTFVSQPREANRETSNELDPLVARYCLVNLASWLGTMAIFARLALSQIRSSLFLAEPLSG